MDQQEKQESVSPWPVLPRLDRLDRLLQLLEEKHSLSGRHSCKNVVQKVKEEEEEDHQCKTLSSALEEVQHKGTLMERLTMLENRVLQLSLEMDEGNSSKSSCSTIPGSDEKLHPHFESSTTKKENENETITNLQPQGSHSPVVVKDPESSKACDTEETGQKN